MHNICNKVIPYIGVRCDLFCIFHVKVVFHSAKKFEQTENSAKIFLSLWAVEIPLCNIRKYSRKTWQKKSGKFSTFFVEFWSWNFNSQSDLVLILTTFFSVASHNETTYEIYPGFSDCAIWNFLFQSFISLMGVHSSFLISNM